MLAKTTRRRFIFVTRAKHLVWDKEWGKWHETKSGRTGMGPKVKELTSNQERKNWHGQKNVVQDKNTVVHEAKKNVVPGKQGNSSRRARK